jgi:hypothetical protein
LVFLPAMSGYRFWDVAFLIRSLNFLDHIQLGGFNSPAQPTGVFHTRVAPFQPTKELSSSKVGDSTSNKSISETEIQPNS